jgi:hypothetical protein
MDLSMPLHASYALGFSPAGHPSAIGYQPQDPCSSVPFFLILRAITHTSRE